LTAVLFPLVDGLGDLGVVVAEDLVEEEDRPFDRRQGLQQD
jgi:hypothetical protein